METLTGYLTQLASETSTPGGGSAATVVAASGAALVAMVARICLQSPKYAAKRELALHLIKRADALRSALLEARTQDEAAFAAVMAATALPKGSDEEKTLRRERLEAALSAAAQAPLHAAQLAHETLLLCAESLELNNVNLVSDTGCAAEFCAAAIHACAYNVRINHRFMKDAGVIARQRRELEQVEKDVPDLLQRIRATISARVQ